MVLDFEQGIKTLTFEVDVECEKYSTETESYYWSYGVAGQKCG